MISVYDTEIKGVMIVSPPAIFEDYRGVYRELFNEFDYSRLVGHMKLRGTGPEIWWSEDISISRKNVLRGIHGDYKTWKLVSCLHGAFYLVVVDWREDSPTYKNWTSITLSDRNYLSVLIPPGCGNGHLVLTEKAIFHYKQSEYYDRDGQFTIAWNDPVLGVQWPISLPPILSGRDKNVPFFDTGMANYIVVDDDAALEDIAQDVIEDCDEDREAFPGLSSKDWISYTEGDFFSDN